MAMPFVLPVWYAPPHQTFPIGNTVTRTTSTPLVYVSVQPRSPHLAGPWPTNGMARVAHPPVYAWRPPNQELRHAATATVLMPGAFHSSPRVLITRMPSSGPCIPSVPPIAPPGPVVARMRSPSDTCSNPLRDVPARPGQPFARGILVKSRTPSSPSAVRPKGVAFGMRYSATMDELTESVGKRISVAEAEKQQRKTQEWLDQQSMLMSEVSEVAEAPPDLSGGSASRRRSSGWSGEDIFDNHPDQPCPLEDGSSESELWESEHRPTR